MATAPVLLSFHALDDPALWDLAATGITITSVRFDAAQAAGRRVTMSGVTRGVSTFTASAETEAGRISAPVTLAAGQRVFETSLDIAAGASTCTVTVADSSRTYDRVAFQTRDPVQLDLVDARVAQLGPERYRFAAGISDRIVERRSFSLLFMPSHWAAHTGWMAPPDWEMAAGADASLATAKDVFVHEQPQDPRQPRFTPPADGFEIDLTRMATTAWGEVEKLYASFRSDMSSHPEQDFSAALDELRSRRRQIVLAAIQAARQPLSSGMRSKLKKATPLAAGPVRRRRTAKKGKKSPATLPELSSLAGLAADAGVLLSNGRSTLVGSGAITDDLLANRLHGWITRSDFSSRIGVLFSDRLRFQPAGLVVGEPLYALALTPNEEVQVRQTVETRRKATTEEAVTREQERELTLSSTWSTDVSEAITDTTTVQMAASVFGSGGAGVPDIPLSGSMGTSGSASAANTYTTQRAVKVNQQITAQATAKMRREHKTRIEVTSEQTSGLSTTRTLRNPNQQRSTTHVFSKVYRRERVTLERYDARLCLRIIVDDPAAALRDRFVQRLQQLTGTAPPASDQPDGGTGDAAPPLTVVTKTEFSVPRDQDGTVVHMVGMLFLSNVEGLYGFAVDVSLTNAGPEYVLAAVPTIEVASFRVEDTGREKIPEGTRTWTEPGATEEFHNYGEFRWKVPPTLGLTTSEHSRLHVDQKNWIHYMTSGRPPNLAARDPGEPAHPAAIGWREVTFRVVATWQRVAPMVVADNEASRQEDMRRADVVTREAVLALRDTIAADYLGLVLSSAAARSLRFPGNEQLAELRSMFAFEEATVENVPYWATDAGRQRRANLASVIDTLPINVSSDEVLTPELTAAQAILFLPINAGFERQALAAVDDLTAVDIDWLVNEIETLRGARFPDAGIALPDYTAVTGPLPPVVTPSRATAWANDWEKPPRKFDVLAAWQDLVPTDGVHVETVLSDSVATDEHRGWTLEHERRD